MARKPKKFATGGTVTDPKTGKTYDSPSYGGASIKGLTSTDPANVARNREAAARYASMPSSGSGNGNGMMSTASAAPATRTVQTRTYTPPPAGYDAGKSGEWNYYTYGSKEVPASTSRGSAITGGGIKKGFAGIFDAMRERIGDKKPAGMKAGGAVKATGKQMRGCGCAIKGTKGKGVI